MLWILVLWLALCFLVGLAANMRGRDGIGWFAVAIVISPFVAGALVFMLQRKPLPFSDEIARSQPANDSPPLTSTFKPDGVYAGVTYAVTPDSAIIAVTPKGLVRFKNIDEFLTAISEQQVA